MVKWVVQRACGIFILELSPWIQLEEALSNLDLAGTCFVQGTAREVPWPHPKFLCSVVWCNNLKHEWCWFKLTHQLLSCNSCHSCEIQAQQPPETAMPQVVLVRVCGNPTVLLISLKIKLLSHPSSCWGEWSTGPVQQTFPNVGVPCLQSHIFQMKAIQCC